LYVISKYLLCKTCSANITALSSVTELLALDA
jgi:hypothetical protein